MAADDWAVALPEALRTQFTAMQALLGEHAEQFSRVDLHLDKKVSKIDIKAALSDKVTDAALAAAKAELREELAELRTQLGEVGSQLRRASSERDTLAEQVRVLQGEKEQRERLEALTREHRSDVEALLARRLDESAQAVSETLEERLAALAAVKTELLGAMDDNKAFVAAAAESQGETLAGFRRDIERLEATTRKQQDTVDRAEDSLAQALTQLHAHVNKSMTGHAHETTEALEKNAALSRELLERVAVLERQEQELEEVIEYMPGLIGNLEDLDQTTKDLQGATQSTTASLAEHMGTFDVRLAEVVNLVDTKDDRLRAWLERRLTGIENLVITSGGATMTPSSALPVAALVAAPPPPTFAEQKKKLEDDKRRIREEEEAAAAAAAVETVVPSGGISAAQEAEMGRRIDELQQELSNQVLQVMEKVYTNHETHSKWLSEMQTQIESVATLADDAVRRVAIVEHGLENNRRHIDQTRIDWTDATMPRLEGVDKEMAALRQGIFAVDATCKALQSVQSALSTELRGENVRRQENISATQEAIRAVEEELERESAERKLAFMTVMNALDPLKQSMFRALADKANVKDVRMALKTKVDKVTAPPASGESRPPSAHDSASATPRTSTTELPRPGSRSSTSIPPVPGAAEPAWTTPKPSPRPRPPSASLPKVSPRAPAPASSPRGIPIHPATVIGRGTR